MNHRFGVRSTLGFVVAATAVASVVSLAGCQTIVGIDDRAYASDAGAPASAQCEQYCDTVEQGCPEPLAVYSTRATCLGVCSRLPPGDPLEPSNANTVACRTDKAKVAARTEEPKAYCPGAGPGGAGSCGSNCANYCALMQVTCPEEYAELKRCEAQCAGYVDTGAFDVATNYAGDTLQCRLAHLSAATVDPVVHCPHTQLHPTNPCRDEPTAAPDCADFCRLNKVACAGDDAVYESDEQCRAVCAALDRGTNADREQNTVGCRKWHLYNALVDARIHCTHVGPGGDGTCGLDQPDNTGNCEAYCRLAQTGCPAEFSARFASQSACQKDCSNRPAEYGAKANAPTKYRVATVSQTSTLQCRLLYAARALTQPAACTDVFGGAACP